MRAGITGGLGFVSSRVARELLGRGHDVVVLDIVEDSVHPLGRELLHGGRVELRRCDLTDALATERALADADAVFHAAALGTKAEMQRPRETMTLNLSGTANALEAARRGAAERFVLASSAVVYGAGGGTLREGQLLAPSTTIYAATKIAGEELVSAYEHQFGLPGISLRFMNVYGYAPPESEFRELTVRVLERIESGQAPIVNGDGSSAFDLVHVDDVARAVCLALESDAGGAVNVGTGVASSVLTVVERLLELTGSALLPELHPEVAAPAKQYLADCARARELLDFEAQIDLDEGLRRLIDEFHHAASGAGILERKAA